MFLKQEKKNISNLEFYTQPKCRLSMRIKKFSYKQTTTTTTKISTSMSPFSSSHWGMCATNVRESIKKKGKREIQGTGDPAQKRNKWNPHQNDYEQTSQNTGTLVVHHMQKANRSEWSSVTLKTDLCCLIFLTRTKSSTMLSLPCARRFLSFSLHALMISWGYSIHSTENCFEVQRGKRSRRLEPPTAATIFLPYTQYVAHTVVLPGTLTVVSPVSQNSFKTLLTDFPRESSCKLEKVEARLWTRDSAWFIFSWKPSPNNGIIVVSLNRFVLAIKFCKTKYFQWYLCTGGKTIQESRT